MSHLQEVQLRFQSIERFAPHLNDGELARVAEFANAARRRMSGRVFWNVNSTAVGGGVAEMLRPLIAYSRGAGVDARWLVIDGNPDFFRVTKRLHHALHGSTGDGTPLDDEARRIYDDALRENAVELCARVQPGDVVLLHDPQTAGLACSLTRSGASVIWRCHIGHDTPGEEVDRGWRFLEPYLECARRFVFSRSAYVPEFCDHGKSTVIQPSIDAFSPKNVDLDESTIQAILVHTGLVEGPTPDGPPVFPSYDGTPRRVERQADVVRLGRPPSWDTPLVVQISRWDPLKDMIGVMHGFASLVNGSAPAGAALVLAGPNVHAVADDPEGADVFEAVVQAWRELPHAVRSHIHLVSLPTDDIEENAAIVNALQRHATVVVQKSLHEGFGLTVTEAMWKSRPVLASAVGGIQDQIENEVNGLLLKDPEDLASFSGMLRRLLEDPDWAAKLGRAARERVREQFLGIRHLIDYARLLESFDD